MLRVQCAQTGPAQGSSSPFTDALQLVLRPSFYFPLAFLLSSPVCHVLCRKGPTSSSTGFQFFRRCHRHTLLILTLSTPTFCLLFPLFSSAQLRIYPNPLFQCFKAFTDTQKASVALLLSFSLFQLILNMNLCVF